MIPFGERQLRFHIELGTGSFGYGGAEKVVIEGLRATVQVEMAQLPTMGGAIAQIYGLTLSQMNAFTRAGLYTEGRFNQLVVEARTKGENSSDAWKVVFRGQIREAYPAMNSMPYTPFIIFAVPGDPHSLQLKPERPISVEGSASAGDLVERASQSVGYQVENNGVDTKLANPYLRGSAFEKILGTLTAAEAQGAVSRTDKTISIWPRDGKRAGAVAIISEETGMIGHPEFEQVKVVVRCLFDPSAISDPGLEFEVRSILKAANGKWKCIQMGLNLSCEVPGGGRAGPGGPWEMSLTGVRPEGYRPKDQQLVNTNFLNNTSS